METDLRAIRWALMAAAAGLVLFFGLAQLARADEVYLEGGDRYSGTIKEATGDTITLETPSAGTVTIQRKFVQRVEPASALEAKKAEPKLWTGELAAGYSKSTGNTKNEQLDGRALLNRKTDRDETTFKAEAAYRSQNNKMDTQKYYGMARYAYNFGREMKWYQFFKEELDHDRFADIELRSVTSTGLGYWFADGPDWKFLLEGGPGLEHTNYRSGQESTTEPIAIGRLFAEKRLFDKLKVAEDATVYPSLKDTGEYRLRSESTAEVPFGDKLAGRLSWINEYNSDPALGKKKHDMRLVSSLVYKF